MWWQNFPKMCRGATNLETSCKVSHRIPGPPLAFAEPMLAKLLLFPQRGVDDRRNNTRAKADTELRQQPAADERADNADNQIANEPKAGSLYDLAGEPSRDEADQEYD